MPGRIHILSTDIFLFPFYCIVACLGLRKSWKQKGIQRSGNVHSDLLNSCLLEYSTHTPTQAYIYILKVYGMQFNCFSEKKKVSYTWYLPWFQTECNRFLPHRRLNLCQKFYFIKKMILWSIWDHVTDKTECQRNFNCQYPTVNAWLFADGIWKNCEIIGILSPVWKHYFRLHVSWQMSITVLNTFLDFAFST